jgi:hypothetical protein
MFNSSVFDQDISGWNVSSVINLSGFMNNKISYSYYDDILNSWSLLTLYNGVTLGMGTIQYTAAGLTARTNIISNYSWTINDGGFESLTIPTNAAGGLGGFSVGGQAIAFDIIANPAIASLIGSTITFQNGETRTLVGYDDYGSIYDIFYDSPISTGVLFPITIGI